jgi:hypothetical protein
MKSSDEEESEEAYNDSEEECYDGYYSDHDKPHEEKEPRTQQFDITYILNDLNLMEDSIEGEPEPEEPEEPEDANEEDEDEDEDTYARYDNSPEGRTSKQKIYNIPSWIC